MSGSQPQKTVLTTLIIDALREITDLEFQRRVWVEGSATEVSSLGEATCALFDDSGLGDALETNTVTFSIEVDQQLRGLRRLLRVFLFERADLTPQEIIQTPEWAAARRAASQILEALKTIG